MSGNFQTQLNRIAQVRRLIETEEGRRRPNDVRLLRLKAIVLKLSTRLDEALRARRIRIASAPRLGVTRSRAFGLVHSWSMP